MVVAKATIIVLAIILALVMAIAYYIRYCTQVIAQDKATKEMNRIMVIQRDDLIEQKEQLHEEIQKLKDEETIYARKIAKLEAETESKQAVMEMAARTAYEHYCDKLESDYKLKEQEYDDYLKMTQEKYDELQRQVMWDLRQANFELDKVKQTKVAAMEAMLREQEIKEQLSFYCLTPTAAEKEDISVLESIKPRLRNPRVLSMLIWSTYYQKSMTALCNKILGTNTVTGIYKITNQNNDMCYIGQSVDVSKRWTDHAKCGLGIDTPAGNKLYKAMQEDGIWSFSWELLEECPREFLDEKEKYYIDLYQSKDYGYNITKGNK